MAKAKKDALQGTLDLLILKTLSRGAMHGYGIAIHIGQVSGDALRVEEGSLYPALHRIEQAGLLSSEWRLTETGRRAKFYSLAAAGRRQLEVEEQEWARLIKGVSKVLRYA
jgi:PadR family transcriptional regulator PadR